MVAEIKITMSDDGHVTVDGAITNKALAYGLLGLARDAIADYHAQAIKSQIIAPPPGSAEFLARQAQK